MIFETTPPCVGLHAIFDSTLQEDHAIARRICLTCVEARVCDGLRKAEQASESRMPTGTWAGRLYGKSGQRARGAAA